MYCIPKILYTAENDSGVSFSRRIWRKILIFKSVKASVSIIVSFSIVIIQIQLAKRLAKFTSPKSSRAVIASTMMSECKRLLTLCRQGQPAESCLRPAQRVAQFGNVYEPRSALKRIIIIL